jgi:hypothetical protein
VGVLAKVELSIKTDAEWAAAGRRKSMHHGASYCNIMHYDAMLMHHDAMYLPAYTL